MEKKEYLNEEQYLQTVTKLKKIGKTVLIVGIVGLILGAVLTVIGFLGFGKTATDTIGSFDSNPTGVVGGALGSMGLLILGSFIDFIGFIATAAGAVILVMSHKREITAFTVQQTMPLVQEGVEKMTPTVSQAAGSIAKEISKGIQEGKNEAAK